MCISELIFFINGRMFVLCYFNYELSKFPTFGITPLGAGDILPVERDRPKMQANCFKHY